MDRMTRDGSITFADRTTPMLFLSEGAKGDFLLHRHDARFRKCVCIPCEKFKNEEKQHCRF